MKLNDLYQTIYIGLEMTRRCNMACFYCHVRRMPHRGSEMGPDEWLQVLTPLLTYLNGYRVNMHLAGGEPFLFKGTMPLIHFLMSWNVQVSLVSNGLEIPAAIFTEPAFKDDRFCFNISLDGPRQGHETARLNYDRVWQHVKALMEAGVPLVIRTTVHQRNLELIEALFEKLNRLGERHEQPVAIDLQPVGGSPFLVIPGFETFNLGLTDYLDKAWPIHLKAVEKWPYVKDRWRFLNEMIFSLCGDFNDMVSMNGAVFGCAGGFSFEIRANGDIGRCEMDRPLANIRKNHEVHDLENLFTRLEGLNSPQKRCILCPYKWACGMCRLFPLMHGYTTGFGYSDCQALMRDVKTWHRRHRTAEVLLQSEEIEEGK